MVIEIIKIKGEKEMELNLQDLKELLAKNDTETPFKKGMKVMLKTITYFHTGEIVDVVGGFVVLKNAAWVADTGKYSETIITNDYSEVEPYPSGKLDYVAIDFIVDWHMIDKLPRSVK